ncbi:MAG TPA: hypothetical protein VGW36_03615 [Pyrinomonadaceae bacterium]|nr:hypothetical protein [Pyrinomonadaceae bacterium]
MKKSLALFFIATGLVCLSTTASTAAAQHSFGSKEYDRFHDVLHPLEHEALPNNDFPRIRKNAALLFSRGKAIIRAGVPRGKSGESRDEFQKELRKFSDALNKFRKDSKKGTDEQLKISYTAVHDSFEMLASLHRAR